MYRICAPIGFIMCLFSGPLSVNSVEDIKRKYKNNHNITGQISSVSGKDFVGVTYCDIIQEDVKDISSLGLVNSNNRDIEIHHLPKQIEESLLSFLRLDPPQEPFSCISFVQKIMGLEGDILAQLEQHGWWWSDYRGKVEEVPLGSLAFMYSSDNLRMLRHVAVKVTEKLFLSKGGPHKPQLLFLDMETMQKLWEAPRVLIVGNVITTNSRID